MLEFTDVFLDVFDVGVQFFQHRLRVERREGVQVVTQLEALFRIAGLVQHFVQLGLQRGVRGGQAAIGHLAHRRQVGRTLLATRLFFVLHRLPGHRVRGRVAHGGAGDSQQFFGLVVLELVLNDAQQLGGRERGQIGVRVQLQRLDQFGLGVFGFFSGGLVVVGAVVLLI
ncbi:hypothetical protein D3C73_1228480 [compost metagenome]